MAISKTELKRLLSGGVVYVEFIKKDGSLRKMWCTRSNSIIMGMGHAFIQFKGPAITARENRLGYVYVFDVQEGDTRLLNPKTVNVESIKKFSSLEEAEIPSIVTRFEKDRVAENGINADDVASIDRVKETMNEDIVDLGSVDDLF